MVRLGAVRFSRLRFKFNENILIASTLAAPRLCPARHLANINLSFFFSLHIDTKVTFNKVAASETRPVDRQTATAIAIATATSASTDAACRQKWSALKLHLVASCRLAILDIRLAFWPTQLGHIC